MLHIETSADLQRAERHLCEWMTAAEGLRTRLIGELRMTAEAAEHTLQPTIEEIERLRERIHAARRRGVAYLC